MNPVFTALTINLTLMRPPPVKKHSLPLSASWGLFRAIAASKGHPRSRALRSVPYAGASRIAAPDTYRGSIAAEAAMAAEQAAVRCTLEMLRCPRTVLCNTRLHVGCSPGHVSLGGGAAHARQMVACLMPRRRRERPHHAQGSWNLGLPPASLPFLWSPANSTGSPTSLPYPCCNRSLSNGVWRFRRS
jgi:hypothetical protein